MIRLRWALARLFAPAPIMQDRFGDEGVFVYYRSSKQPYRFEWMIKAEKFRLKGTSRLPSMDYGDDDFTARLYHPSRPFIRFVGTLGCDQ